MNSYVILLKGGYKMSKDQSQSPTPMELFRGHLDAIYQIFREIEETNKKIRKLNFPTHIYDLPLAAGLGYGVNWLIPWKETFFLGLFIGNVLGFIRFLQKDKLEKQTISNGQDISELIRQMKKAIDYYLKINKILEQHPELREQLQEEDYRKILDIDRISSQTDHRLRKEKREIDRNPEKALDFSERRSGARKNLKQSKDTELLSLTKRSDQQGHKKGLFKNFFSKTGPYEEIAPKLITNFIVDELKAAIAPEGQKFQYPNTFRHQLRDRYHQKQIRNARKVDTTDPEQQAMNLIKDIQIILKKQKQLDKRITLYSYIKGKPLNNLAVLGISTFGGFAISEFVTGLRDYAIGLIPQHYNGLVGAMFGYGLTVFLKGTIEKYVDKKTSGKHLATRAVALWLMEEKLAQFRELKEQHSGLGKKLAKKRGILRRVQKIRILAEQIDDWTYQEVKNSEKSSSEYDEQIEGAKAILDKQTDYKFLVPVISGEKKFFTTARLNNDVYRKRVKRFYETIDAKNRKGKEPLLKSFQVLSGELENSIYGSPVPDPRWLKIIKHCKSRVRSKLKSDGRLAVKR